MGTGTGKNPKVVWIADQPGWAYHNRALAISAALPGYEHEVVMNPMAEFNSALIRLAAADLIICPDPRLLPFLPWREKIIQHVNAVKIFV